MQGQLVPIQYKKKKKKEEIIKEFIVAFKRTRKHLLSANRKI